MDEAIKEFVVETREGLDRADRDLVLLEKDPSDAGTLRAIFRTIHTIKGTCGFLGFARLQALAHAAENLLSRLRNGSLRLSPEMISGLLRTVDAGRQALATIEQTGAEGPEEFVELTQVLSELGSPTVAAATAPATATTTGAATSGPKTSTNTSENAGTSTSTNAVPVPKSEAIATAAPAPAPVPAPAPAIAPDKAMSAPLWVELAAASEPQTAIAAQMARTQSETPDLPLLPREKAHQGPPSLSSRPGHTPPNALGTPAVAAPEAPITEFERPQPGTATEIFEGIVPTTNATVRVSVSMLDKVMNLVGELVLARNQALQNREHEKDPIMQRLSHITTGLQESVVQMRMQPISSLWGSFPRMTRDLAISCNKLVQLKMEGHETELDRSMLEVIKDPMVHLLRNAIDHGIERPQVRMAAGKLAEGCLTLRAYHEEGQVSIEVSDDGAGIDRARLKAHAIQQGLLGRAEAEKMSDREVLNLLFVPGFSTAGQVTSVSGRGVGMDVVKTNIERIGGTVDLQTSIGRGTTVKMTIPLTLAIMPALIVRAGFERFAIPRAALLEIVCLDPEKSQKLVEHIQDVPLYRLRGSLLPLVYLDVQLALSEPKSFQQRIKDQGLTIIVVQVDERRFGLVVDEICDTVEIVVKPLGRELKGLRTYAGATIMGDGLVGLILDVSGVAERANVFSEQNQQRIDEAAQEKAGAKTETFLLFMGPDRARMALPAGTVARLEKVDPATIEHVAGRDMVQYRDTILPLVYVEEVVLERRSKPRYPATPAEDGLLDVIVCEMNGETFGLVVCQILDIVKDAEGVRREGGRPGVACTAVVDGKLTELIDLPYIVSSLTRRPSRSASPPEEKREVRNGI